MNRIKARFLTLLLLAARLPAGGCAQNDPGLWGDADFFRGGWWSPINTALARISFTFL